MPCEPAMKRTDYILLFMTVGGIGLFPFALGSLLRAALNDQPEFWSTILFVASFMLSFVGCVGFLARRFK